MYANKDIVFDVRNTTPGRSGQDNWSIMWTLSVIDLVKFLWERRDHIREKGVLTNLIIHTMGDWLREEFRRKHPEFRAVQIGLETVSHVDSWLLIASSFAIRKAGEHEVLLGYEHGTGAAATRRLRIMGAWSEGAIMVLGVPEGFEMDAEGGLESEREYYPVESYPWPLPFLHPKKYRGIGIVNKLLVTSDSNSLTGLLRAPRGPERTLAHQLERDLRDAQKSLTHKDQQQ